MPCTLLMASRLDFQRYCCVTVGSCFQFLNLGIVNEQELAEQSTLLGSEDDPIDFEPGLATPTELTNERMREILNKQVSALKTALDEPGGGGVPREARGPKVNRAPSIEVDDHTLLNLGGLDVLGEGNGGDNSSQAEREPENQRPGLPDGGVSTERDPPGGELEMSATYMAAVDGKEGQVEADRGGDAKASSTGDVREGLSAVEIPDSFFESVFNDDSGSAQPIDGDLSSGLGPTIDDYADLQVEQQKAHKGGGEAGAHGSGGGNSRENGLAIEDRKDGKSQRGIGLAGAETKRDKGMPTASQTTNPAETTQGPGSRSEQSVDIAADATGSGGGSG